MGPCHGSGLQWNMAILRERTAAVSSTCHTVNTHTWHLDFQMGVVCVCVWEACTHLLSIFSTSTWFHRLAAVLTDSLVSLCPLPSLLPSFLLLTYGECLCFSLKYISIFPRGWSPFQQAYNISHISPAPSLQPLAPLSMTFTMRLLQTFLCKATYNGRIQLFRPYMRIIRELNSATVTIFSKEAISHLSISAPLSPSLFHILLLLSFPPHFLHLLDHRLPRDCRSHRYCY